METHQFTHRGKKRVMTRANDLRCWQYRCRHRNVEYRRGLGSPLKAVAERNAKTFLDSLLEDRFSEVLAMQLRKPTEAKLANVGAIIASYESNAAASLKIKPNTVRGNVHCLRSIVCVGNAKHGSGAKLSEHDVDRLAASVMADKAATNRWLLAQRAAGRSDASIRSVLRQARSVLSSEARDLVYAGLRLPVVEEWLPISAKWDIEDTRWNPLTEAVTSALDAAADSLWAGVVDPAKLAEERTAAANLWTCYMLMARCGLRNCEVRAARWSWIEERKSTDGTIAHVLVVKNRPDEDYQVKNGLAGEVRIPREVAACMVLLKQVGDVFILRANHMTARRIIAERTINDWLRPMMPRERRTCAYELRKWAGSRVAAQRGIYAAQRFLRHRSIKTTESYYVAWLQDAVGLDEIAEPLGIE